MTHLLTHDDRFHHYFSLDTNLFRNPMLEIGLYAVETNESQPVCHSFQLLFQQQTLPYHWNQKLVLLSKENIIVFL